MPEEQTQENKQNVDEILTTGTANYEAPASESGHEESKPNQEQETVSDVDSKPEDKKEEGDSKEADSETDDYGNPKKESKLYTEEEVNERINKAMRERLARMKQDNQPSQQQQDKVQQNAQDNFQYDESSSQSWEQQLESFIENTMQKVQQRQTLKQQQELEQRRQEEFQDKFHRGMSKFNDFEQVVSDKPITDAMVSATRGMNDPAAFIYAASKNHADELSRISRLQDPIQQVTEMMRLENKVRVNRQQSRAPSPPSKTPQGTASTGEENIDVLIEKHAQKKAKMRGWM